MLLSVRVLGIDDRAGRENDFHGGDGMVRIDCWPATHTARVIGQYATDGGGVNAGRIRSHAAGVRFQNFVNTPKCSANIATNPRAVVLDFPAAPVLPHIDEDVVALRLAVQAGSTGPEGRMAAVATAILKNSRYVIDVLWLYDHARDIPVRAGIRCIAHQVADTMPHQILAKYLDQISPSAPPEFHQQALRRQHPKRVVHPAGRGVWDLSDRNLFMTSSDRRLDFTAMPPVCESLIESDLFVSIPEDLASNKLALWGIYKT